MTREIKRNSPINFQQKYATETILWIIFFCFSTMTALIFQKFLLPLFPSFHGGSGLLNADSVYFHSVAMDLAKSIKLHGWGAWTVWPATGATGNVAILGALYVFFGNEPSLIIPINAVMHATSGILIYLVGCAFWPGRVGMYAGIITSILFIIFPSALNWYGQVHKDGYVILGMLIILYSWICGLESQSKTKRTLWILAGTTLGMLLVIFVRPYNLKLLIFAAVCIFILLIFVSFLKCLKNKWNLLVCFFAAIIILVMGAFYTTDMDNSDVIPIPESISFMRWNWHNSNWIPDKLEHYIETAAKIRVSNIYYGISVSAKSLVDKSIRPDDAFSVAVYLPRALEVAFFSPFPVTWVESLSVTRIVAIFETLIWYLFFPGVFLTLYYKRSPAIYMVVIFGLVFLAVYGFIIPNVGTLYRIRYLYLFLFMLLGVMGWINFFLKRYPLATQIFVGKRADSVDEARSIEETTTDNIINHSRFDIANAGLAVILLTLISYLLFFIRDVIMARWFGLSNELDSFFIAFIIPMFLVAVLCNPMGTVIIPAFLSVSKKYSRTAAQELISQVSMITLISLAIISIILYLLDPILLPVFGWNFPPEKIQQSSRIMVWVLPIFLFSGLVILGNSVLNALGKFTIPSLAQASVPIVAILALMIVGHQIGILAVAIGMFVGQLINLLIVGLCLKKNDISLLPKWGMNHKYINLISSQYFQLVISAFFISAVFPVNNMMAASLSSGSVAAFNLGNKFVLFVTGVIGTGIATVMLPHFSSFIARSNLLDARRELSFFLFLTTVLSIPLSILFYLVSEQFVRTAFLGNAFSNNDVRVVAKVVEFGIIQLPFFSCNMLLLKFATANRNVNWIMITSMLGLFMNVIMNFLFMKYIGVAGISLASTLSLMMATILFIIVIHKSGDIYWVDIAMITLNWMLFLTVILCFHYHSFSGVIISLLALLFISLGHLKVFFRFSGA